MSNVELSMMTTDAKTVGIDSDSTTGNNLYINHKTTLQTILVMCEVHIVA